VVLRRLLTETYAEALRQGPAGWIDDVLAFRRPWGVDLAKISSPVLLWHGAEDTFSPVGHTRWLGAHIPRAEVQIDSGIGHFGAIEVLPRVLAWVADGLARPERRPVAQPVPEPAELFSRGRADRSPDKVAVLPAAT
jgi:pimeloyl-ACP methyl ester carboxylesterase